MEIEKEINQKKFHSEFQKAYLNIIYTSNWLNNETKNAFKPFDLTKQQYNVLRILKGSFPDYMNPGQIKNVMLDKSPDLTRLIDRLVEKGYVERKTSDNNRRMVDIRIVDKGIQTLKTMNPIIDGQIEKFRNLSEDESKTLSYLLDKLRG